MGLLQRDSGLGVIVFGHETIGRMGMTSFRAQ